MIVLAEDTDQKAHQLMRLIKLAAPNKTIHWNTTWESLCAFLDAPSEPIQAIAFDVVSFPGATPSLITQKACQLAESGIAVAAWSTGSDPATVTPKVLSVLSEEEQYVGVLARWLVECDPKSVQVTPKKVVWGTLQDEEPALQAIAALYAFDLRLQTTGPMVPLKPSSGGTEDLKTLVFEYLNGQADRLAFSLHEGAIKKITENLPDFFDALDKARSLQPPALGQEIKKLGLQWVKNKTCPP